MKILQIIHGYPLRFNAGSEIYTQMLVHGLLKAGHDVAVFTREEDPFKPDYSLIEEFEEVNIPKNDSKRIPIYLVNVARQKDRFISLGVNERLKEVLNEYKPDIVNIQHLNHLSITLIDVLNDQNLPIVFTLHDFWLACPRGQFLQINYGEDPFYVLCDGQEDIKCAKRCYSRYHTGTDSFYGEDIKYWTNWVKTRQDCLRTSLAKVDAFIAPSNYLMDRIVTELPILANKTVYLDYGFDLHRYENRARIMEQKIVFGYIGTHIIAKGINLLIKAFSEIKKPAILRIWGRKNGETTPYLKSSIEKLFLPEYLEVDWRPEYINQNIISEVFNQCDAIIVPSIWAENSPLVIHEALQARVPVITANYGGMAEYVQHMKNGLLFNHRDENSLREQMDYFMKNKEKIDLISKVGYINSDNGNVMSVEKHTKEILKIYQSVLEGK